MGHNELVWIHGERIGGSMRINERKLISWRSGEASKASYETIDKPELGRRPAHASAVRRTAAAIGVDLQGLMTERTSGK